MESSIRSVSYARPHSTRRGSVLRVPACFVFHNERQEVDETIRQGAVVNWPPGLDIAALTTLNLPNLATLTRDVQGGRPYERWCTGWWRPTMYSAICCMGSSLVQCGCRCLRCSDFRRNPPLAASRPRKTWRVGLSTFQAALFVMPSWT